MSDADKKKKPPKPGKLTFKQAALATGVFAVAMGALWFFFLRPPKDVEEKTTQGNHREAARPPVNVESLAQQLRSQDAATAADALQQIKIHCGTDPAQMAYPMEIRWGKALLETHHYQEAADLTLMIICEVPDRTVAVCGLMRIRILALTGLGKYKEALSAAKSLWNIAPVDSCSEVLYLMAACLQRDNPDDPTLTQRFKTEQQEGASSGGRISPILSGIQVEPEQSYQDILDNRPEITDIHGNYLYLNIALLAGKPTEARWALANIKPNGDTLVDMTARIIKAEDGTLGRAYQFIEEKIAQGSTTRPIRVKIGGIPWAAPAKTLALLVPLAKVPFTTGGGPQPDITPARTLKLTVPLARVPFASATSRP